MRTVDSEPLYAIDKLVSIQFRIHSRYEVGGQHSPHSVNQPQYSGSRSRPCTAIVATDKSTGEHWDDAVAFQG